MTIGTKIKQLRINKGITQEKLADYLNVSGQAVSKWENNTSTPDIALLPMISTFFGVAIDDLFTLNTDSHLERIENMLQTQADLSLQDETYVKNYLLGLVTHEEKGGRAYQLLSALCNHRANSYHEQAKIYAKQALKINPADKMNHVYLVEAHKGIFMDWNHQNHHDLINFYKDFTQQHPDIKRGHMYLADHLIATGRLDEAQEALDQIQSLEANYLVSWYEGRIQKAGGDLELAHQSFGKMIEAEPDNWVTWATRADEYARVFDYEKAIECNLKAFDLQEQPRYIDAHQCSGMMYENLGQYDKAIDMYQKALLVLKEDWKITFGTMVDTLKDKIATLKKHA